MKIYIFQNGVTLVGKAWEVREKLREYAKEFETVEQWVNGVNSNLIKHRCLEIENISKKPL